MNWELRRYPHPDLLRPARPVRRLGPPLERLAARLGEAILRHGGVGLAAPQLGSSLRVALVALDWQVCCLVNPRLLVAEGREVAAEECLSLPGRRFWVARASRVEVVARDPSGRFVRLSLAGRLARRVQHELDHLDGILLLARAEGRGDI